MDNKPPCELDRLLDRALADCPQVPLGLEARILQHVSRADSRRGRRRVYTLATLVLAASFLGLFIGRELVPPPSPTLYVTSKKVEGEKRLPGQPVLHEVAHRKRLKRTSQPVKEAVFPSPTPMTSEERALVRFVLQSPAEAAAAFADVPSRSVERLHVEPLNMLSLAEERSR